MHSWYPCVSKPVLIGFHVMGTGRTCARASTVMLCTSRASCAQWRCCIPESGALCTAKGTASTGPWGEPCGCMGTQASTITTTSTIFLVKAVTIFESTVNDFGLLCSSGQTSRGGWVWVRMPYVPRKQWELEGSARLQPMSSAVEKGFISKEHGGKRSERRSSTPGLSVRPDSYSLSVLGSNLFIICCWTQSLLGNCCPCCKPCVALGGN